MGTDRQYDRCPGRARVSLPTTASRWPIRSVDSRWGDERLLPRRLGESASDGAGPYVRARNPIVADWDWPSPRIGYIVVRCLEHGGPSLAIDCGQLLHDQPIDGVWASDHFGLTADLVPPPPIGVG